MSNTVHVSQNPNTTYKVQVESPSCSERKNAGQSLDDKRLKVELQQHGCTPEQIEQGMNEIKAKPDQELDIIVEKPK